MIKPPPIENLGMLGAKASRHIVTANQALMGTHRHATARFQIFRPAPGIQSVSDTLQTLKERLIQWSPLGAFVGPERYRNSPVRLELVSDHAPDIVLEFYDTYTDNDGNLTRLLTEPGLDLTPGQYWLNVLIPYLSAQKGDRQKKRHFISRLPLKLLDDDPPAHARHRAIISDIDGTVYYTAYQTFLEMLSTAYTKPAGKVFVDGIPLLLRTLSQTPNTTLHGVSCSPENLRNFIRETTAREGFQFDTLQLNKNFSATRSRERIIYKIMRCLELLEELPKRSTLIFIGDNKEQDLQTYELLNELLLLMHDSTRQQVITWVDRVITLANAVRADSVTPSSAPFIRTRLEALALNVLARQHAQPAVFIVESHQPTKTYATQLRKTAERNDTQFCKNGQAILTALMQDAALAGPQHTMSRLNFLLRNTREPELLAYLDKQR